MRANHRELEALVDPEVAREELRELMSSVEYPEGWFYVERAVVLAFWLCAQIDPELDTMQVGYPYILPLIEEAKRRSAALAALPSETSDAPEEESSSTDAEPSTEPELLDESAAPAE